MEEERDEDRISDLPCELLAEVLSFLTLEEAARTSVLSHRWQKLWLLSSGPLNFHRSNVDGEEFVDWVNQVLEMKKNYCFNGFGVCYPDVPLDAAMAQQHVDNWVNISFKKRVKSLKLAFGPLLRPWDSDLYQSPAVVSWMDSNSNSNSSNFTCTPTPTPTCGVSMINGGFGLLETLHLGRVNVKDEAIGYLLANCPYMEQLHLVRCFGLVNLKVPGTLLRLTELEISFCYNLKQVDIYVANIFSFKYEGRDQEHDHAAPVRFHHPDSTVSVAWFGGDYYKHFIKHCSHPIIYSDQGPWKRLTALTLDLDGLLFEEIMNSTRRRKVIEDSRFSHENLKVVELLGFLGQATYMELARRLLENAGKLEVLTIEPRNEKFHHSGHVSLFIADEELASSARTRARELEMLDDKFECVV
ncbi:hypothetical protein Dimus_016820 [Dionaea muscipula]